MSRLWSSGGKRPEPEPRPTEPRRSHGAWDAPPEFVPPPPEREAFPKFSRTPEALSEPEPTAPGNDAATPPHAPGDADTAHRTAPPHAASRGVPASAGTSAPPADVTVMRDASRQRRRLAISALGVSALVGAGLVVAALLQRPASPPVPVVFRVDGHPTGLVAADGRVWVAASERGLVWVLDAKSGRPAQPPLRIGGTPARLALAAGGVWAGDTGSASIVTLAPTPGEPLRVGPDVADIAVTAGAVWVASAADGTVRTIERDGSRRTLHAGARIVALAADPRRVVALDAAAGTLTTIDARTRRVDGPSVRVGGVPVDVALTGDSAWIADARAGTVRRYDLRARRPAGDPIPVGRAPVAVAGDGDDVYVAVGGDRTLVHIHAGKVASRTDVGAEPSAVALDPRYAWVSAGENRLLRVAR